MWAQACDRPACIPIGRPRGVKRLGVLYENSLAALLPPSWVHGQWWEYVDSDKRRRWCQTDFWLDLGTRALVLEAKLTWVPDARKKLEALYRPVMETALQKPVHGIVVARKLVPECQERVVWTLGEALVGATNGAVTWHAPLPGQRARRR